jgi:DNA repair protein RecO (recombination protein O)
VVHKTTGIVFKFFKYRETSVIVKIFTARFGVQTYIVNGVRSGKKGRGKMALLQPLTLLDMVVYYKENSEIQRMSEMRCHYPYRSIPYDVRKTSMALFIAEVLYKCVREEGESERLYLFLEQSLLVLDELDEGYQNFHLQFLLKLSKFLGYGMDASISFFQSFHEKEIGMIRELLEESYAHNLRMERSQRQLLLRHILEFYQQHNEGLRELRSVKVLQELF